MQTKKSRRLLTAALVLGLGAGLSAFAAVPANAATSDSSPTQPTGGGSTVITATSTTTAGQLPTAPADLPSDVTVHSVTYGPAPSASGVHTDSTAATWACTIYASDPYHGSGNTMKGDGWQQCSGTGWAPQRLQIDLQKRVSLIWTTPKDYTSDLSSSDYLSHTVTASCSAGNTAPWRVITTGYAEGDAEYGIDQSLNQPELTCGG